MSQDPTRDTAPLTDTLAAQLPDLTAAQWGKLGAGAGLVLAGTGLVSIGTLIRLAIVGGGAALAYSTWKEAAPASGTSGADASAKAAAPRTARPSTGRSDPSIDARPSLRDTLASGNDQNSPPGLTSLTDVPVVDLRGA